jgi:uncharacterized paraquat-inducible protein A
MGFLSQYKTAQATTSSANTQTAILEELKEIRFLLECIALKTQAVRYCSNCDKTQYNNGSNNCPDCGQKLQ